MVWVVPSPLCVRTWHTLATETDSASLSMEAGEPLVHTVEKCERKMNKSQIAWLLASMILHCAHVAGPWENSPGRANRLWKAVSEPS